MVEPFDVNHDSAFEVCFFWNNMSFADINTCLTPKSLLEYVDLFLSGLNLF
jgi:hypothetical protein